MFFMDSSEEKLTIEEVVIFTSPRYHRLIMEDLKPETKNGDLVSALGELRQWGVCTSDTVWEKVKLTKKGQTFKKLIKKLLDLDALHVPQSEGLFDYRTEPGRKAIIELIRFFSAKLNFQEYIQYLQVPLFDKKTGTSAEEGNALKELLKTITQLSPGTQNEEVKIDYSNEEHRNALQNFLKRQRGSPRTKLMDQKLPRKIRTINFNLSILRKYLKNLGINRVEPLFAHFNTATPALFRIHERQFTIQFDILEQLYKLLEEHLHNFREDENRWLKEYLTLLEVPTKMFGLRVSDVHFTTKEIDAFLNLALVGPKILAGQFAMIPELGTLNLILFPITLQESIVISCSELDMLYYFTIPTDQCRISAQLTLQPAPAMVPMFQASRKRFQFGKVVLRSPTATELVSRNARTMNPGVPTSPFSTKIDDIATYAQISAMLFTLCELIAQKITPNIQIPRLFAVYENGLLMLSDVQEEHIVMTEYFAGKVQFGPELERLWEKISESLDTILDRGINNGTSDESSG